jgi:hypothetical protein
VYFLYFTDQEAFNKMYKIASEVSSKTGDPPPNAMAVASKATF